MKKKTFRGKWIDMDTLTRQNENTIAAGNMGVNAKGDRIGPGGKVIEASSDRARKHYTQTKKTVAKTSLKPKVEEVPAAKPKAKAKPKRKPRKVERETDTGDIIMEDATDEQET